MTLQSLPLSLLSRLSARLYLKHNIVLYPQLCPFTRFVFRRGRYLPVVSIHFVVRSSWPKRFRPLLWDQNLHCQTRLSFIQLFYDLSYSSDIHGDPLWIMPSSVPRRSIGSKNGLISLISEWFHKIENRVESRDIGKSERSGSPRFRAPIEIEVEKLAMEKIERRTDGLRTGARGVRSLLTIRMEEIEKPHRKEKHLRCRWMYRRLRFLSNSKLVGTYCDTPRTNH
jgi:hypothetical protein